MQIKQIHSMQWATSDHSFVRLVADTDEDNSQIIGTPYSDLSIIWDAVKAYPVEDIAEYVEPVIEGDDVQIN